MKFYDIKFYAWQQVYIHFFKLSIDTKVIIRI